MITQTFTHEDTIMTLGLCMIVKNEEKVLKRCLDCVKNICDEIIVVDTGSYDNTVRIAESCGAKVFHYAWNFDFAAARNYSFSYSSCDYILWLDADDIISPDNQQKLIRLKASLDNSVDAYFLRYDAAFDENGNVTTFFYRERILRRAAHFLWKGAVHETVCINSNSKKYDIAITHLRSNNDRRGRNLFIFAHSFANGTMPDERQKYYFARELSDSGLYDTAASVFENFLLGNGWIEDKIGACRALAFCYRQIGNRSAQIASLFKSFDFAPPRPEICCDIGLFYVEEKNWEQAVFWFKLAINQPSPDYTFSSPDCRTFIPCIWLCVCYDRLGNLQKAFEYNERAGSFKPNDKNYLHNKQYFLSALHNNGENL